MPKSTFLKLSEEKQNRILKAAEREFLSVPYSQVSINKIIKKADISRGSFYQYFEDKEDLFVCVLQEHKNKLIEIIIRKMEEANGDVFACVERYVDAIIEHAYHDESGSLQMLFGDPAAVEIVTRVIIAEGGCDEKILDQILNKIDKTNLDVEDDTELLLLVEFIVMTLRGSIGKIFIHKRLYDAKKEKTMLHAQIASLKKHYRKTE